MMTNDQVNRITGLLSIIVDRLEKIEQGLPKPKLEYGQGGPAPRFYVGGNTTVTLPHTTGAMKHD